MKIGVVGLGYIGSVTSIALADAGYEIVGIDIDKAKVNSLSKGESPIYEPNLKEMLVKNANKLRFSTDYNNLKGVDHIFVIVPTPTKNGKIYLDYINSAVDKIKEVNNNAIIIIKSTVIPGTAKNLMQKTGMTIISNPEFTKEGTAIEDTLKPDRIVIGGNNKKAIEEVKNIWEFTNSPVIETTNENAEMIKYASNSFLAVKVSFINEIANLCEKVPGCDVEVVAKGVGLDKRIAPYFLKAGMGFGGSCFPKDTAAFISFSKEVGENLSIIESAVKVNSNRILRIIDILENKFNGKEKDTKIGILGLTFKADTDDTRESQAIKLANELLHVGFKVNAYDPKAKVKLDDVKIFSSAKECIDNSDAVVIATEWPEFENLILNDKFTIDMRRILSSNGGSNLKLVGLYE
ncbi:UDP-glucose/GDP-mannose dehydrogenase family protein [Candidatus Parvarchaeota archaeon]|uniref:UDP-glucose 6-dehydrogenase n=1 Tax=Candidatus Acidifodinimicrobium mancum TaxID=2898728 RepID=A0A8T3V123_9ARCH|nr:UDP-glucose/GDP-mannose dehydrogenase family protein [Candidatus Acidifodinimicrobium mancum]